MMDDAIYAQRLAWPLDMKEELAMQRVRAFGTVNHGKIYVSFSGGKDSTVLLHLARRVFPDIRGMFLNTGLEFPEIVSFVKSCENIDIVKPKLSFRQVIERDGWPIVDKEQAAKIGTCQRNKAYCQKYFRRLNPSAFNIAVKFEHLVEADFKVSANCCSHLKKIPAKHYERRTGLLPIVGIMATESSKRAVSYKRHGCNIYDSKRPMSRPMMIWTEKDVWDYINKYELKVAGVYDMGYLRTGCIFCGFGAHQEKEPNRFQRLKMTHPKLYKYCMDELGLRHVLEVYGVKYE